MNNSIAILGRQPELGLAELESLYGSDVVIPVGSVAAQLTIPPSAVNFARLGGTIKLCGLISILDKTEWRTIQKFLIDMAPTRASSLPQGKMHLGISAYGFDVTTDQLLATGLSIKKAIHKTTGRTVRLVPNKNAELNTAQVSHNKLTGQNGWELVLIRHGDQTFIGQTVHIQDIDDYTIRDRSRPKRDARVGMLPPKLAQIIINLAVSSQISRDPITILDPFCGTGVILQEALLMGYTTYGTDLETRMIAYSQANLEWLTDRYHLTESQFRLETNDATNHTWRPPIDAVASETYLGRPFTAPPTPELLAQTASGCNLIIKKFLQCIHSQLKPGTRLCLAIPAWHIRANEFRRLPLIDQLSEMGYNQVSFQHVRGGDLLYYREDQIVARQLLIITRK